MRGVARRLRLMRRYVHVLMQAFVRWVEALRTPEAARALVLAPSFSHAEMDPVPDAIRIEPHHRIVLVEGLYCNLALPPWDRAAAAWDLRWVLDVPAELARTRVAQRHVAAGIVDTLEAGLRQGTTRHSRSRRKRPAERRVDLGAYGRAD